MFRDWQTIRVKAERMTHQGSAPHSPIGTDFSCVAPRLPARAVSCHGRPVLTLAMALLAACLALAGCAPTRHYEAALVLQDIAAGEGPSRLKRSTPAPLRQAIAYSIFGRSHQADLYLPGASEDCPHCPRAAIVAVPGAVPQAKDDPRLVAFANTLARAGFAVLVPEMPGFRRLRVRPSDSQEIADALRYLGKRSDLTADGRAGIFAFSYAVGPAVLAALEADLRERVRFIVGLGGYHDLPRAMRFFTTGWFEHAGKWHKRNPDETGKMVLAYASLDYLSDAQVGAASAGAASDRVLFDRMVELRGRDPVADLSPLAAQLSTQGKAVYALAFNPEPTLFPERLAALPAAMRADIERLDLARRDLKPLRARLLLVHGKNDNLIPWPESLALADAAPEGQAEVFLIHHVLGHVDLHRSSLLSWCFWHEDLPDLWRLWRVLDRLLAERGVSCAPGSGKAPEPPPEGAKSFLGWAGVRLER